MGPARTVLPPAGNTAPTLMRSRSARTSSPRGPGQRPARRWRARGLRPHNRHRDPFQRRKAPQCPPPCRLPLAPQRVPQCPERALPAKHQPAPAQGLVHIVALKARYWLYSLWNMLGPREDEA